MTWSKGFDLAMVILASPVVGFLVPLLWQQMQARGLARSIAYGKLAIQFATEERAKAKDLGRELTGPETLRLAVDFMVRNAGSTEQKATDVIHALLPESSEGAASSQAQAVTVASVSVPFGTAAQ